MRIKNYQKNIKRVTKEYQNEIAKNVSGNSYFFLKASNSDDIHIETNFRG